MRFPFLRETNLLGKWDGFTNYSSSMAGRSMEKREIYTQMKKFRENNLKCNSVI